jgi:predicted esterase
VISINRKRDPIIPVENTGRLATTLREAGSDVMHRLEGAAPQLVFDKIQAAKKWLCESSRS